MKMKSLVIVNYNVTVKKQSNFAHTAHHARIAGNNRRLCCYNKTRTHSLLSFAGGNLVFFKLGDILIGVKAIFGDLSEVDTRYW